MIDRELKNELLGDIVFYLKLGNVSKNKTKLEKLYWDGRKQGLSSRDAWEYAKLLLR